MNTVPPEYEAGLLPTLAQRSSCAGGLKRTDHMADVKGGGVAALHGP